MKRVDSSGTLCLLVLSVALGRACAQTPAALGGVVRDPQGAPELGALVELLGPSALVVAHTYTDDHGRYVLSSLVPGRYQLRSTAAFLRPALRKDVRLTAGGRTLADLTMGALFEAGDWFPVERRPAGEPADNWRWTLRSTAERPLLRLVAADESDASDPSNSTAEPAGEAQSSADGAGPRRLQGEISTLEGTAGFEQDGWRQVVSLNRQEANGAVELLQTSFGHSNEGPLGSSGANTFTLETGYQQSQPITHSLFRAVASLASYPEIGSARGEGLQAINLATGERIVLGDLVTIDAGTLLSAERLVATHLSSSPFFRAEVHPSSTLAVMYRFAASRSTQRLEDLGETAPDPLPLADAQGRPLGNVASHQQIALTHQTSHDSEAISLYQDGFAAGFVEGGGLSSLGELAGLPITENRGNGTFVAAVGGYRAQGLSSLWTRSISPSLKATVEADLGTTLQIRTAELSLLQLQSGLKACIKPALNADLAGSVHRTSTTFDIGYRWQPTRSMAVINSFEVPANEAYLNLKLRQSLWRGDRLRGVSAVLEASNLLEEGYQPVVGPDGKTLFLAQIPRSLQAGLVFSF